MIVDTGPLIAYFDRSERHHGWVVERLEGQESALLVCEPVLTEACYLLARFPKAQDTLLELVANGALDLAFSVRDHVDDVRQLLRKYRDTPMSLADACIVRMAEINDGDAVLTLDSDFLVYRRRDRAPLEVIHPSTSP